jgi:ubiquinone/menaquinone biosynthesis C-methylase UbiE
MTEDANEVYALGSSGGETARLRQQAVELAPDNSLLLDRVGSRPGQRAIDLGCGPRGILDLLAERVGPAGWVTGLDADPVHTAMAADFLKERGVTWADVVTGDARATGLPAGSFDLVHARTLLINIPEPGEVVAEMVRLAKPGGYVAALEIDVELRICYPPHPAVDRVNEIFPLVHRRHGSDPMIGRRMPELFRQAGLTEIGVEVRVHAYPPGHSRRTILFDLIRAMRSQVLEMGLATEAELDQLDAAGRAHVTDPDTIVVTGLLFLVWGRKG